MSWRCRRRRVDGDGEVDLGAFAAADPVLLEELDARRASRGRPSSSMRRCGVGGDAQHPLAHGAALDGVAADFALAVDHFLVGEHGAEFGAPVHGRLGDVGEADAGRGPSPV